MKLKNLLLVSLLALFSFSACKKSSDPTPDPPVSPPTYQPDNSFKIVAYMPSYRDPNSVDVRKYKMITHLFYAFLNINPIADGSLNPLSEPTRFAAVQQRAKENKVKFGISIMGSSANFVTLASSAAARTKFVTNVVAFAKNNNLDGVDLDWEYPSTSNGSAETYVLLVQELSTELHKVNKFLSAAVTPAVYAGGIKEGIKQATYEYIDFFNIMQYDGPGYDSTEPLNHASYKMSVASLDVWLGAKALPRAKAVVGIPLYGKDKSDPAKSIAYRAIEASGADVNQNVATVLGVDYGFNGIPLVKQKAQLAKDRANGIMFWEFSHDSDSDKSLIKAANDQLGRVY